MAMKLHIKKGDTVKVMSGDSKGHTGKVLEVFPEDKRALVEGANLVSKHTKPNAKSPNGGIVKKEAPIHISNLMLICPETGKPTRIGRKLGKNDKLVRYSKKSKNQEEIK
jgi:large subunit ribosomal protein L24